MQRRAWLFAATVAICCGGAQKARVAVIEVQANGGGPLLITAIGGTLQLAPLAKDAAGHLVPGAALIFTTSDANVATVDQSSGLVTGVANGTATLSAGADGAFGSATVTVAQAPDSVAVVPPSASVERGAAVSFSATVVDARGHAIPGALLIWSAGPIATVSNAGVAVGVAVGNTLVVARAGSKTGSASLTVAVPAAAAVAVHSTASGALASIDETRALSATATDARGAAVPEAPFTWSSNDAAVASVDASGLVTARQNGAATITATSGAGHASIDLTVAQAASQVAVSPATQSVAPGALFTFTAQALDAHAHPVATALPAAVWSIDDASVATIGAASGQVSANANATSIVTTLLHAVIGSLSGSARLTVDPAMAPVVSVSLPPPAAALASLEATVQLTATAVNQAGNPVPGVAFSWSSDHPAVATVDATTGLVTARGNGAANITASGGGKSASASVAVQQAIAAVVLAPPALSTLTSLDDTVQLSAVANDALGSAIAAAAIAWSSSAPGAASVGNTGLVTARANGSARITAASGAVHDQVDVTVAQAVKTVAILPADASIAPNTALSFSAAALDARGHLVAGAPAAAWTSSDTVHAPIDAATGQATIGNVTQLLTLTIGATISTVSGSTGLTIDPALTPVSTVVVAGGGASLASVGDTVQLSAVAQDAQGRAIPRTIAWSVQDQSADVVTIGATGLVTAVGNGQKTLVASAGGVSGTATVTVAQVLASVRIATVLAGASTTLTSLGDTVALSATGFDARSHAIAGGTFAWRSDSANAAVDQSGLVTAVANGNANLFASAGAIESTPGFAVTVAQAVDHIAVSAIAATTLTSIGDTLQLTAHAFDARNNAVAATFVWSPTSGSAAVVGAANGLVTAVSNGTTSVQATAGGKSGALAVTVAQAVASIAVSGTASLASLGATAQLAAVSRDARGNVTPAPAFAWRSGAAAVVSVDATTGVATAVSNGTASVFASAGGVESPGFAVTVAQSVASISVAGTSTLASFGETAPLAATAKDALGSPVAGIKFTWSIQDASSNVVTVDALGVVTAVANGQKSVVASAHGKSGTLLVTVAQAVATIAVSATGATTLASINTTVQLSAAAADARGNLMAVAAFAWSTGSAAAATVDANGLVTARANGAASITASAAGKSGSITITVQQAVASVVISPSPAAVGPGLTIQLAAVAMDSGGTAVAGAPAATWSSADTTIATVDAASGLVTGVALGGPILISATLAGKSQTVPLTVSPCPTTSWKVTAPGFFYAFDGGAAQNPVITVCRGQTFTFHLQNIPSIHPFCIWNGNNQLDAPGVTNNCASGTTDVVWAVPASLPNGAQYRCHLHLFGNSITVN